MKNETLMVYLEQQNGDPSIVPLSLLLQHKERKSLQKVRLKSPSFNGEYLPKIKGGGLMVLTPTPYTKYYAHHSLCTLMYPPLSLSWGCAHKCTSHLDFRTLVVHFSQHLIVYILLLVFTNKACARATLHASISLTLLVFPPMDENLHDIRPH